MKIIGIIPARMPSTRFPGKPLAKILGIPMLRHAYFRSKMSNVIDDLYVATCDQEIVSYVHAIGGKAIMTADTHERALDRTATVMLKVERNTEQKVDIVVMIQGDEPMLYPEMIDSSIRPIVEDVDIQVVNLMASLKSREEHDDPNEVKVLADRANFALHFSREPIPSRKKGAKEVSMYKQICIIPFRRDFIVKFNEITQTHLEITESVDMIRVLEHGYKVKMIMTDKDTYSIDTHEDLARVEKMIQRDIFFDTYQTSLLSG